MGSAFHQLCPRYSGTLTPTAPTAIKLWDTFTLFTHSVHIKMMDIIKNSAVIMNTVIKSMCYVKSYLQNNDE